MNPYQKAAILIVRTFASAVTVVGILGLGYFALELSHPDTLDTLHREKGIAALVWTVVGPLLFAASGPIGRFLGRGLG